MSNGAMMTHRLGIELADRIAAIGPVVGGLFGDEPPPAAPVSAIIFNGVLDQSIPMAGGPTGGRFPGAWDGTPLTPAAHQAAYWAAADGCDQAAEVTEGPAFTLYRHACPPGIDVEYYLVKDNGHAWPGGRAGTALGDPPTNALNATEMMWDFFRQHSRAGTP
jgi:polyhydroxybutyrate depolymerase